MTGIRKVSASWLALTALAGAAVGATAMKTGRTESPCAKPSGGEGGPKESCCPRASDRQTVKCPVHRGENDTVIDDREQAERLRVALVDGIFRPWMESGRAPTPAEFARRIAVDQADAVA